MTIEAALIAKITGVESCRAFGQLGLVTTDAAGSLSFVDDPKFIQAVAQNAAIEGVFITQALAEDLKDLRRDADLLIHPDPRWAYYTLYNAVGERDYRLTPSEISSKARIHPTAFIAENNVKVGDGTLIGPNVTVLPDVIIGERCIIQPGSVLGSVGFEIKRTSRGILTVFHDGVVHVDDEVEIGANACIDKGFRGRPTVIGRGARIDNLVHVAHSARVGPGTFVIAGTVLGGSADIGEDVWLSINTSVAPGIRVDRGGFASIGAVVTKDVGSGEQVTGNFAVPHEAFLRILKANLQGDSKE